MWEDRVEQIGPCLCGAWHGSGEFQLRNGILYRYGERVNSERKVMMQHVSGIKINCNNLIPYFVINKKGKGNRIQVPTSFGNDIVVGIHLTGNAGKRILYNMLKAMVEFPVTIEMPCGFLVSIPGPKYCFANLGCPCGKSSHYIVRWTSE